MFLVFETPMVGVLARALAAASRLGLRPRPTRRLRRGRIPAPQLRISQPQFRSTVVVVSRKGRKGRKGFLSGGCAPRPPNPLRSMRTLRLKTTNHKSRLQPLPAAKPQTFNSFSTGRGGRMVCAKQNIFCGAVARAIRIGVSFTILSAHPHNPQHYSAMSSSMAES